MWAGWDTLDEYYRPRLGELTVVHGIPGHGKSSFINHMVVNLIKGCDWKFVFYSAEMQPPEEHLKLFVSQMSGFPVENLTSDEINKVVKRLDEHVSFMKINLDKNPTIDDIIAHAHWHKKTYGLDGLVIDPWNELDHSRPAYQSETEYISTALGKLKRLIQTDLVHCWLIAHPMKILPDREGRLPKPGMYHISGSAHFRNKADMGLMIWRDVESKENLSEIHVQKVRYRANGQIGMVHLKFDKLTQKYHDVVSWESLPSPISFDESGTSNVDDDQAEYEAIKTRIQNSKNNLT